MYIFLLLASQKSTEQARGLEIQILQFWVCNLQSRAGRLETEKGFLCSDLKAEFIWETTVFALGALNWLDEAQPHYRW